MDLGDKLIAATIALGILLVAAALVAAGVWSWQDAADKRACRRTNGTVVHIDDHAEWHCVGATPEVR